MPPGKTAFSLVLVQSGLSPCSQRLSYCGSQFRVSNLWGWNRRISNLHSVLSK